MSGHGKTSYVCLPCRASYKQHYPTPHYDHERHCPRCGKPLVHVGSAFAPPPRRDEEGWRVLSVLLHAGIRFHKSCCGGPGYRPRTLREVKERLAYAKTTGEPIASALLRPELPYRIPHRARNRCP
ncbi:deoxyxylulose-5-phosphate synthase [Streptomyces sp. NPDC003077]|uniref:deoxyxylulose-5-phosphate synthase n=1 Tax=Streptomyces sp. NPDC003077 TaxID=3154443 RepID=UPI0033A8B20A